MTFNEPPGLHTPQVTGCRKPSASEPVPREIERKFRSIEEMLSTVEHIAQTALYRNALLSKVASTLAEIAEVTPAAPADTGDWRRIIDSLREQAQLIVERIEPDADADPAMRQELAAMRERIERADVVARASLREYFLLCDSRAPLEGLIEPGQRGGI